MPRVGMVDVREKALPTQIETFDEIVATRGAMTPPFAGMLHAPELTKAVADLGVILRYRGGLSDHVRELVICVTAHERGCAVEWAIHSELARKAGLDEATLEAIAADDEISDEGDAQLVTFVRELCRSGEVADATFQPILDRFGESGTVELLILAGYYTLLAMFLNALEI